MAIYFICNLNKELIMTNSDVTNKSQLNNPKVDILQANSRQTRAGKAYNAMSLLKQTENGSAGFSVETKPAEKINGIEIYKTSSALMHLNKQDPNRIAFKQNVKEINKLLKVVQAELDSREYLKKTPLGEKILKLPEISDSSYMPDTTAFEFYEYMKLLKPQLESLNDKFKNFSIEELQQKVGFNEAYKDERMGAKKEIIRRNEESFGDKYTDLKYKEKAEDSSYTFMADGFYAKEKDVNGGKKGFLRRKYSSVEEQLKQFDEGQERVKQAKKSFGGVEVQLEKYSELTSKMVDLQKKVTILNNLNSLRKNNGCPDLIEDLKKARSDRNTQNEMNLKEKFLQEVNRYNEEVKKFLKEEDLIDGEIEIDKEVKNYLEGNLIENSQPQQLVRLYYSLGELIQNLLNSYSEQIGSLSNEIEGMLQPRIDLVTDEGKRNNGPGLERKDLNLSKLETRSKDEDDKAIIEVPGKGQAKLDVSIETLHCLFPEDEEKTMSPIQQTGDCYLINIFTQFMKDPEKRVDIYKCFKESEDGKTVTVKYPGGKMSLTYNLDESGEIKDFKKSKKGVDGSVGFQILEELQACERVLLSCKTEKQKEEAMSILQKTDRSIDERLEDICKKGIQKNGKIKSEGQSAFSHFIDGGNIKDISELMGYEVESKPDGTFLGFVIGNKSTESLLGRLLDGHAQAIVDSRHYGVIVEEPNSSNRQGFVSFDNVVSEVPDLYYYQLANKYGEDKLAQLRNNMDLESILKGLQDFEEPIKSMIEYKNKQLEEKLAKYEENLPEQLEEKKKSLNEITGEMNKLEELFKMQIAKIDDVDKKSELISEYEDNKSQLEYNKELFEYEKKILESRSIQKSLLIREQKELQLVELFMDFAKLGENANDTDEYNKLANSIGEHMDYLNCTDEANAVGIVKSILLPTPPEKSKILTGMGLSLKVAGNYKRKGASNFE